MSAPVRAIDAVAWCASADKLDDFSLYRSGAKVTLRCEFVDVTISPAIACTWSKRFGERGLGDVVDIALEHWQRHHGGLS